MGLKGLGCSPPQPHSPFPQPFLQNVSDVFLFCGSKVILALEGRSCSPSRSVPLWTRDLDREQWVRGVGVAKGPRAQGARYSLKNPRMITSRGFPRGHEAPP